MPCFVINLFKTTELHMNLLKDRKTKSVSDHNYFFGCCFLIIAQYAKHQGVANAVPSLECAQVRMFVSTCWELTKRSSLKAFFKNKAVGTHETGDQNRGHRLQMSSIFPLIAPKQQVTFELWLTPTQRSDQETLHPSIKCNPHGIAY